MLHWNSPAITTASSLEFLSQAPSPAYPQIEKCRFRNLQRKLEVSVDMDGNDEVAVLAKSFNEMARNLRRSEKSLVQAYDKTIEAG